MLVVKFWFDVPSDKRAKSMPNYFTVVKTFFRNY